MLDTIIVVAVVFLSIGLVQFVCDSLAAGFAKYSTYGRYVADPAHMRAEAREEHWNPRRAALPAVIATSVNRLSQKKRTRREFGFSLIELLIVIAIILIILAVAMPRLSRARMYAQEMAAMKTITTIHTAQAQYFSQFGKFAGSLTELGPPSTGQPTQASADLISGDLALGEKSGYKFVMQLTPTGYSVNANPGAYNTTGSRTFFSDQNLVTRQNYGQDPATITSPEIK